MRSMTWVKNNCCSTQQISEIYYKNVKKKEKKYKFFFILEHAIKHYKKSRFYYQSVLA
jgi:hypothetical protein